MRILNWLKWPFGWLVWHCSVYYRVCQVLRLQNARLEKSLLDEKDNLRVATTAYKKARRLNRDQEELTKRRSKLLRQRNCLYQFVDGIRGLIPEDTDMKVHSILHEIKEEEHNAL